MWSATHDPLLQPTATDSELRLVISCDITAVRRTDCRINVNLMDAKAILVWCWPAVCFYRYQWPYLAALTLTIILGYGQNSNKQKRRQIATAKTATDQNGDKPEQRQV